MNDVIYIKRVNDRWRVWMGRDDEEDPRPAKTDAKFCHLIDANQYAGDWVCNSSAVDVVVLHA